MTWRVHHFPILSSTNDQALDWLRAGRAAAGDVIVAAEQTGGRGRPGRTWHSPRGALLLTAVLPFWPERVGWTALAAGIAVARGVGDLGAPARVKWPNDVLLGGRKLAGVLAEAVVPGLVAVGIGMNVTNPLPEQPLLAGRAARLADVVPGITLEQAQHAVLVRLAESWELLARGDPALLRAAWEALDATAGRRVRWSEAGLTGRARGVDHAGALVIEADAGGTVTAPVGEVGFLDDPSADTGFGI